MYKMKKMMGVLKRLLLIGVVLLVLGGLVGIAAVKIQQKRQALARAPKFAVDPVPVHVATARSGTLSQSQVYLAVVDSLQTANVSARLTAEIESIACDEGDTVQAGQVMAVLDSREIRAEIDAAKSQVLQAKADLEASRALIETLTASVDYWKGELTRDQSLRATNVAAISQTEIESTAEKLQLKQGELAAARHRLNAIQYAVKSATEKQRELQTRLTYCTILSPFDGVVTKRFIDAGDLAAPGKLLFRIEDRSTIRLTFDVPQDDLAMIHAGQRVSFPAGGKTIHVTLSRIYPSLNAARMAQAEVDVSGDVAKKLTPGSYLTLEIELRSFDDAAIIPVSALVAANDGASQVYIVDQGRVVIKRVELLATQQNELAVSGIEVGATVVTHPFLGWARYHAGQKVEVIQ